MKHYILTRQNQLHDNLDVYIYTRFYKSHTNLHMPSELTQHILYCQITH
jgi:hypothetical protein